MKKISGSVALVKITIDPEFTPIVPVLIPRIADVRAFAQDLHQRHKDWQGITFGWEAEYHASRRDKPPHSKIEFTPAEFWIGDATIWGFSMMWEDGDDRPPSEAVSDWNVVKKFQKNQSV
ncbi:MAG: hypothetical protein HY741_18815 [Chloroflexi bacterium]|nr:hypothetical protein [Chloroflexota bacterium]